MPKLYHELAAWWPLLSAPADYAEEAGFAVKTILEASPTPPRTVLELGSGGGNNAFHMKKHLDLTLVDLSPEMLEVSRRLNPECKHVQGDMRTVRLGQTLDAVFIHDAIMYMTTEQSLRQAIETAFVHCRSGGVVLIMPDHIRETFVNGIYHHGGHDSDNRHLRYMEWTFDPEPSDTSYVVDFAYMLREGKGAVRVEHDTHVHGLFSRDDWNRLLAQNGLMSNVVKDPFDREIFVAIKGK